MEKYRYGPLVYVTAGMDESEGNYYWNGSPPVGYDETGIPVDKNGMQCLDIDCPLHPAHEAKETVYNKVLDSKIPTIAYFKNWFDDNFLIVSDDQIKKYIIKAWFRENENSYQYVGLLRGYKSVDEIIGAVWQQEEPRS